MIEEDELSVFEVDVDEPLVLELEEEEDDELPDVELEEIFDGAKVAYTLIFGASPEKCIVLAFNEITSDHNAISCYSSDPY